MRPLLRVNADDFGRSARVNAAIVRAHREGVLTSASLMIGEPAAAEAVALARENPRLKVGLHLVLADGAASAHHEEALGLTNEEGKLAPDPVAAGLRYFRERARLGGAIRSEIEAQLERFRATGLALHHVDGHLNIHLHPAILGPLCELLPRFGSPEVRVPREPARLALRLGLRPLGYKISHATIFKPLGVWARRRLARAGLKVADRVLGLLSTFDPPDERVLLGLLGGVRGYTELYLHPGAREPGEDSELAALLSPRVAAEIDRRGIALDR
jgi:hopanoid biosynthesis associated protein HpnK